MKLLYVKSRKRIANLWMIMSCITFLLLVAQTITGKYGEDSIKAWGWFSQTIIPGLSLIIGVLVIESKKRENAEELVEKFYFRIAMLLSFIYLLAVVMTILCQPIAFEYSSLSALDFLDVSNLYLGALQGLVVASLGIFFSTEKEK